MWREYFSQLVELFKSYVFLSALLSWFVCQFMKSLIAFIASSDGKRLRSALAKFGATGGLPSSHSSVVIALTLSLGFKQGFDSDVFIITFFLASIVIRDAVGVRLSNGVQAKTLNSLGKKASEKLNIDFSPVREINGHTNLEVFVGAMIGLVSTIICVHLLS